MIFYFSNLLCNTYDRLLRVLSDLKVTHNYLSDLNEILLSDQWEDCEYNGDNFFQNSYATSKTRLLISDLKANYNYLSDLDEMFNTKPLKNGKYNGDNYFSNF